MKFKNQELGVCFSTGKDYKTEECYEQRQKVESDNIFLGGWFATKYETTKYHIYNTSCRRWDKLRTENEHPVTEYIIFWLPKRYIFEHSAF